MRTEPLSHVTEQLSVHCIYFLIDVKIHIVIFWVLTPCSLVDWYQRFGGTCFFHLVLKMEAVTVRCYVSQTTLTFLFAAVRTSDLTGFSLLNLRKI
jgi:ABC-type cobalamin transport system permease subunit